jgi:hypothetical protein
MTVGWLLFDAETWLTVWQAVVIGTCTLFAGLVLGADVGAVRDLRIMLRDLSDKPSPLDEDP